MTVELHSLIGPYALGALDEDERDDFESHLDSCPTCAEELDGFIATSIRLGEAVAAEPPAELRAHILAAASKTSQERPTVVALRPRSLRKRIPGLIAAAAVVVAAAGVTAYVSEHQQVQDVRAEQSNVERVMTAGDAVTSESQLGSASMTLTHSPSEDALVLAVKKLPALNDQTYQLWTVRDGVTSSAGLIDSSDLVYVGQVDGVEQLALTVEPAGGSERPTSLPLATMQL
ncbi:anti-sigma factor [Aeromicrobium sp. Sec7.5]|uniref:anti-sigma factor n=1 Tax=Aeromicrobium sp. Sec7.5 TaxID=3121276 RepID=UPI002FE42D77